MLHACSAFIVKAHFLHKCIKHIPTIASIASPLYNEWYNIDFNTFRFNIPNFPFYVSSKIYAENFIGTCIIGS